MAPPVTTLNNALKGVEAFKGVKIPPNADFKKEDGGFSVKWTNSSGIQSVFISDKGTVRGNITVNGEVRQVEVTNVRLKAAAKKLKDLNRLHRFKSLLARTAHDIKKVGKDIKRTEACVRKGVWGNLEQHATNSKSWAEFVDNVKKDKVMFRALCKIKTMKSHLSEMDSLAKWSFSQLIPPKVRVDKGGAYIKTGIYDQFVRIDKPPKPSDE